MHVRSGTTVVSLSQPVSLYRYSVLVKIGSPVIILAASKCSLSNLHELETPQLKLIPLTSDHKHLGITFSEEAKWNKHVENLIKSVSKHICVLRKLKYKLNRKKLEKLYLIYIRPIFEYACEVWNL
jgi:hypothetical protein